MARADIGSHRASRAASARRGSSLARARRTRAGSPSRLSAAPRKNSAIVAVSRGGPWTLSRATIWAARTAALSSRGIDPWPHVPRTEIR